MRSSKSRSRSKTNRPRTLGNIINRVFDSSGPEGKVRGTPQQIIEKYLFLARDAQLSNDRVAAENFLQHAEHYTRMLGEANRELAAEQESRQQYQPQNGGPDSNRNGNQNGGPDANRNGGQDGNRNSNQNGGQNGSQNGNPQNQRDRDGQRPEARSDTRQDNRSENRGDTRQDNRPEPRQENRSENRNDPRPERDRREDRQPDRPDFRSDFRADYTGRAADPRNEPQDVIDLSGDEDIGLVETPEASEHKARNAPAQRPAPQRRERDQVMPEAAPEPEPEQASEPEAEPVLAEAPAKPKAATRRPRSPKKASVAVDAPGDTPNDGTPREAAE